MDLSLCSFNCCSMNKNIDLIRKLTDSSYDIIMLQETMLTNERLGDLGFIDENYESVGVGATFSDKSLESMSGRPQGGMACLWKANSVFNIDKIVLENNMIIMCISIRNIKIVLVNVYLNSDLWETSTLNNYLNTLSNLELILADYNYDCINFLGDFNADPFVGRAWRNLDDFITRNALKCFDFDVLDMNTFTFTSYGGSHCKWLDHFVGRNCAGVKIRDMVVHYDLVGSDHLPISANLTFDDDMLEVQCCSPVADDVTSTDIDWGKLQSSDVELIEEIVLDAIGESMNGGANRCHRTGCRDQGHIKEICMMYDKITSSIEAGSLQFRKEKRKRNKYKGIPGWNRNVKEFHKIAREHYLKWLDSGRCRDTVEFSHMTESRGVFKKALNDCKVNEFKEICISIEDKYKNKDETSF